MEIVVRRWVTPRSGRRRAAASTGVDVQHRLAHPHEDGMVDRLEPAEVQRLVDDLPLAQVAAEAHLAGGAERARERAARLRRDAHRPPPVAVAHQHRLDRMTVDGVEQRLDRAVARVRLVHELERGERNAARRAARRVAAGQVRHLVERRRAARSPFPDLARAVGGLAGEQLGDGVEVHSVSVARSQSTTSCALRSGGKTG